MLCSKMFTMDAIIASLKNILCDQVSTLEYLIKDKLSESINLRVQLIKSREELKEKEATINAFKKREKVLYKLVYVERCEKESLKLKLSYNSDNEEDIQREVEEAMINLQGTEQHQPDTLNDKNSEMGVWNSDQDEMPNNTPANDISNRAQIPATSSRTVDNVDESVIIIEPEEEEIVHCDTSMPKEAVEEGKDQVKSLDNNSLLKHLEEILNSDDEETNKTTSDDVKEKCREDEKKDQSKHEENLSTSLPDLDASDVTKVLDAGADEMDLSNNTNQFIESLLQDDTDSLPDTSLIDETNDVDVFKLLDSVHQTSNDTFDKDDVVLDAPIEVSSDCDFQKDEDKKRRRSPIRERWETKTRKNPRITLLGKETIEGERKSERFTPASRKIISAKKMSRGKLKRSACRQCEKCLREDCGECVNCLDKPKNGGLNKIRQRCMERRCEDMSLYN